MNTLILLFLICAPQLKDRPIEWYENKIKEGMVVNSGSGGWGYVEITEIIRIDKRKGLDKVEFQVSLTAEDGYTYFVRYTTQKKNVAKWFRDNHQMEK